MFNGTRSERRNLTAEMAFYCSVAFFPTYIRNEAFGVFVWVLGPGPWSIKRKVVGGLTIVQFKKEKMNQDRTRSNRARDLVGW